MIILSILHGPAGIGQVSGDFPGRRNRRLFPGPVVLRCVLILHLSLIVSAVLPAQNNGVQPVDERLEAREAEFEKLLHEALDSAESGEWDTALAQLDEAEQYYPDDPRIADYRASFLELAALESAQTSWSEGTPSEVTIESSEENGTSGEAGDGTGEGDNEQEEPRFAIDRGDKDPAESPILTRDFLRSELALKFIAVDPDDSTTTIGWSTIDEFLYASLGVDVAGWMPFTRRSLGFNFRCSGYAYRPEDPSLMVNSLDLGVNIRGFLAETKTSRLELGLDFGGAFQSNLDVASGEVGRSWSLFLGLWFTDPLLFHLFNADSLENLVFGGGIRTYSSFSEEIFEMVNYRIDGSWVFLGGHVGIRFEWWDFVYSNTRTNMMAVSLIGGYRF